MKRYVILIIVLSVLIAGLAVGVYLWLNGGNEKAYSAIQAIPTDASLIFRVEDFSRLKTAIVTSKVWESVNSMAGIGKVSSTVDFIDSLAAANLLIRNLINNNKLFIALYPAGIDETAFLFTVKIPEGINATDFYSFSKLQAVGTYREEEKYYNRAKILTLNRTNPGAASISVAVHNGILLVSNSVFLVEKAIAQLDCGTSFANNAQFLAISKTAGSKVDANLYINLKHLPAVLKPLLGDGYRDGVETLGDIAQWIELDLSLSEENLVMSGLSTVADSTNSYLSILAKQKPVDIEMAKILPAETGLLIWLGISGMDDYLESYRSYLDRKGTVFKYTQQLSRYRRELGTEVQEYFKNFVDDEIGIAYVPPADVNSRDDWYIIAKTRGASSAKQYLQGVAENFQKGIAPEFSIRPQTIKIDNEKTVDVFRQPVPGLYSMLLGSLFSAVSDSFYCFVDNWIVLGSSSESLERYVKANIRNNVLKKSEPYALFENELPRKANYFVYLNPGKMDKISRTFCNGSNRWVNASPNRLQGIGYLLIGGNSLIFNNFTIVSGELLQNTSRKNVWETKLDAGPAIQPQLVVNHNTGEKEVFIQDSENSIYLINNVGRILWKRKLEAPIMGDVSQVDIFRNRKLQMAFNTSSNLYVIDRNGKDVTGFPVPYTSPATNPVSVIDYEGNRNYRFFQACADRKIYLYGTAGKPVKGWNFGKTETMVTDRIGFVRVKGLDYIVVFDGNRPYLLNRKGEERVKIREYFAKAPNSTFSLGKANNSSKYFIVTTDTIGLVRKIHLDGKVEDVALQSFTRWHSFVYEDINADGVEDYVVLDNNTLYAFDSSGKSIFQKKIGDDVQPNILCFDFGKVKKLGLVAEKSNKIYLVNAAGKVEETFPWAGSTPFVIAKISRSGDGLNLLVGSEQGSVVNYSYK